MKTISALQMARYAYKPKLPEILENNKPTEITVEYGEATTSVADQEKLKSLFPKTYGRPQAHLVVGNNPDATKKIRVGVILSGGQAPGGHNVIAGLFDGIKKANPESELLGFLNGPDGLLRGNYIDITSEIIDEYRNTGGFDIIGSGRTKIETPEQYAAALSTADRLDLDAIVVIGGDDSNTNAAVLAEHFAASGKKTRVIGVPKTIDGDLKNEQIETSFGFDTASKTFAELIGNIARDCSSAKKYWHFIRLMGRSASHIALECALQTQPNICLIAEEVAEKKMTLRQISEDISYTIANRAEKGENFGIVLVPEGLVEFIPEMKVLIVELNDLLARHKEEFGKLNTFEEKKSWILKNLSSKPNATFSSLPDGIAAQFLADRDPHGNVQVSRIETEKLVASMVEKQLAKMKKDGTYKGKFSSYTHFFGYEGRSLAPSNFDADYCYTLGYNAFILIASGATGYISCVQNLTAPSKYWICGGAPLTMMMNIEHRNGRDVPVIRKALVDLEGKPFKELAKNRNKWATNTSFVFPGAIQYFGPSEVCDATTKTLQLEHK